MVDGELPPLFDELPEDEPPEEPVDELAEDEPSDEPAVDVLEDDEPDDEPAVDVLEDDELSDELSDAPEPVDAPERESLR